MGRELKDKYINEIYFNVVKALIIMAYFFAFNLLYVRVGENTFDALIDLITMIFLFITIVLFEKAYKKDNGDLAIQGIEMLVLSIHSLTVRYITEKLNLPFQNYVLISSYIFAIYYVFKAIVIYTKGKKEDLDKLSDIKEIVKDEPIKKEATKKITNTAKKELTKKTTNTAKKRPMKKTTNEIKKKATNTTKKDVTKKTKKVATKETTKTNKG